MKLKITCHAALLACALFGLTGCETVEHTVSVAREKISSIDFSLPSFSSKKDETAAPAEQEIAAMAAANSDCPPVEVINELNSMHQFIDGKSTRAEDRLSSIRMTGFKSTCKRNESNVIVDLDIRFEGELGPKAQGWNTDHPSFAYPYFIAVTAPGGSIMAKEVFGVTVTYDKEQNTIVHEEHLRQIIPAQGDFANGQELLMGFQLTEGELSYNRALLGSHTPDNAEAALSPNEPALVYEGDPALESPKPKTAAVKKPAPVVKPTQKPTAPAPVTAEPAAPIPAPATPAAVTTEPMPAVTAVPAPAPAAAAAPTAPPAAATPAATPPAEDEEEPSSIELLEDQTNAPEPPPLEGATPAPVDITAPTTP